MAIHALVAGTLLSYAVKPTPSPLTAAYDGASLEFLCGTRSGGAPVLCDRITVRVPIGAGAEHLTDAQSAAGITPDLDDTQDPQQNTWSALAPTTSGSMRVFVFEADRDPSRIDGWNLRLFLKHIKVSTATGNVTIEIEEHTQPPGGAWGNPKTTVTVSKAPENFEFHSFRPMKMMVPNGESPELTWVGSPAEYKMYWGLDSEATMDPTDNPPWSPDEPLTNTTGYMLQAKVDSPNGPMFFTQTCVVSVEKPDLQIGTLDAFGKTVAHDGFDAYGTVTLFKGRRIQSREFGPGVDTIAPTDGLLFMEVNQNGTFRVHTSYTGIKTIGPGLTTIPVAKGSPLKIQRISADSAGDHIWWVALGVESLDL